MSYPREMENQNIEGEKRLPEMEKGEYLTKLPAVDRQNLQRIIVLFEETAKEEGRSGYLLAVGGTVTKPPPRKDIDLVVMLNPKPSEPVRTDYPNYFEFVVADFKILVGFVHKMLQRDNRFEITQVREPELDREFDIPLRHGGLIKLSHKDKLGVPFDLISGTEKGPYGDTMRRPYVVLSSVENQQFIPLPNLRNPQDFQRWLETYIQTPIKGFEDLKHPDGTPYTKEEQLEATRKQIADVVDFKRSRREPLEDILKMLMNYAYESGNTSRT